MLNEAEKKLEACYQSFRRRIDFVPEVALILGSGLGAFAERLKIEQTLDYREIEGFPVSTVEGHKGRFIFGTLEGVRLVCMQGRVHYYEGYKMTDVVLPVRLMRKMGARVLFLTNAAGGVDTSFQAGDLMLIEDQISTFVPSPLIGPNANSLGPRFADMSEIYDADLRILLKSCASRLGIALKSGVYVQLSGPAFETPAEIRMIRALGGSAVGMSTACEALAANHMGMLICGISCITNLGAGMTASPLCHQEVQETADRVAETFARLMSAAIAAIGAKLADEN